MESNGYPMCIHVTAATRALLADDPAAWADYGCRYIKGALHNTKAAVVVVVVPVVIVVAAAAATATPPTPTPKARTRTELILARGRLQSSPLEGCSM